MPKYRPRPKRRPIRKFYRPRPRPRPRFRRIIRRTIKRRGPRYRFRSKQRPRTRPKYKFFFRKPLAMSMQPYIAMPMPMPMQMQMPRPVMPQLPVMIKKTDIKDPKAELLEYYKETRDIDTVILKNTIGQQQAYIEKHGRDLEIIDDLWLRTLHTLESQLPVPLNITYMATDVLRIVTFNMSGVKNPDFNMLLENLGPNCIFCLQQYPPESFKDIPHMEHTVCNNIMTLYESKTDYKSKIVHFGISNVSCAIFSFVKTFLIVNTIFDFVPEEAKKQGIELFTLICDELAKNNRITQVIIVGTLHTYDIVPKLLSSNVTELSKIIPATYVDFIKTDYILYFSKSRLNTNINKTLSARMFPKNFKGNHVPLYVDLLL